MNLLLGIVVCLIGLGTTAVVALPSIPYAVEPRSGSGDDADTGPGTTPAPGPPVVAPVMEISAGAHSGIAPDVLAMAVSALSCAVNHGDIERPKTLTVIDYSLPSTEPRLWVYDVATGRLLFKEIVAHGRNTGENLATHFSDTPDSRQTSIGLFVTGETYVGSNGYSLRMDGLEPGFNGRARERAIVMHGAPYVDAALAAKQGRIGRSWGCPALREAVARDVIDTVRGGGVVFSYYPDEAWLETSRFLNCDDAPATVVATN